MIIITAPTPTGLLDPPDFTDHGPSPWSLVRPLLRGMRGVVLAVAALASLAAAVYVVVERVGFAPVLSPSMQPTFGPGDLAVTRAENVSDLQPGQAAVLPLPDAPGQRFVHRIIDIQRVDGKVLVRTKGDNNPEPDRQRLQITSAQVPVVVGDVPGAGRVALLIRGGAVRLGVLLLTCLCGLSAARRILRG